MTNFFLILQYNVPQQLISRLLGYLARCKIKWIKNGLIKLFIRHYQVDMTEAARESINDYVHFNDFFTRELKTGVRPICSEPPAIVSPVDGVISQSGKITEGQLLQAKGHYYSAADLLADQNIAALFDEGLFITLYLSPKDYHCVHMPLAGRLLETRYVPGRLFSVNQISAEHIPNLFARNERLVSLFETDSGLMAVVMVGAMIVAGINTVWADGMTHDRRVMTYQSYQDQSIVLDRGDKMGCFYLGSTVIVLFENQSQLAWSSEVVVESRVRMGEKIGLRARRIKEMRSIFPPSDAQGCAAGEMHQDDGSGKTE